MLLAVDTNILARALVDDGSDQCRIAAECLRDGQVFVSDTVIIEAEWLLRSQLKVPRAQIQVLLSALLSWKNVEFADRERIAGSVLSHAQGVDFADALHTLSARNCEAMLTYDDDFVERASRIPDSIPVQYPPGYQKKKMP